MGDCRPQVSRRGTCKGVSGGWAGSRITVRGIPDRGRLSRDVAGQPSTLKGNAEFPSGRRVIELLGGSRVRSPLTAAQLGGVAGTRRHSTLPPPLGFPAIAGPVQPTQPERTAAGRLGLFPDPGASPAGGLASTRFSDPVPLSVRRVRLSTRLDSRARFRAPQWPSAVTGPSRRSPCRTAPPSTR